MHQTQRFLLFLLFLLLLGLLLIAIIAMRHAIADYYFDRAKRSFDTAIFSDFEYSYDLSPFLGDINIALTWRASHADSLDFKANLLYKSWILSPDGQYLSDSKLLQDALLLHGEAQKYRKNWVFSAARQALIYSHQPALDSNFGQWFEESHRLGLYETSVAHTLMSIGLQNWRRLSERQKSLTLEFVRTSIEQKSNSPQAMKSVLDRYQKRREVCEALLDTDRKMIVCDKLEANY